jgi:hypothetical protein
LFPSPPEIRITVNGKNTIFDPRTGRTTVTNNWALQVADVLTDPEWGLGDGPGNSNVIVNGDFSQGAAGWIFEPGWALGSGGTPAGSGNLAIFTGPGTSAVVNEARINCLPGYLVAAKCWSLGESGATGMAVLRLTFYDSSDGEIGVNNNSNATPNTYVWTLNTMSIAAPAGAAYAVADFAVYGGGAGPRWFMWGMEAYVPNTGAVNTAQLVAAANVCDELVTTSQGAEARYAQHIHYDTSTGPGDALQMMMPSAAGRLGRIGGEWWIWPAYWQGPSYNFDQGNLIDAPTWTPYRSFKELFNRVNGTYIAPNFPYNTAGNLYDHNGWYYGTRDNVWPFAWEPTNYPQYAADPLHGYAADQFLAEDGGQPLPRELSFRGVISIAQAQRVAKIALMRNRMQGSGSFRMGLEAWQVQPVDVMSFTWAILGMSSHFLEAAGVDFMIEPIQKNGEDDNQTLALSVAIAVVETDPSVYQWSLAEELSPYDVPASPRQIPATPAAPTSFTVTSSAGTALVGADGIVIPRARLDWTAPEDNSVTAIQMQYQAGGAGGLGITSVQVVSVQHNHVGLFHYVLIVRFVSPPTVSDGAQCNFGGLTTYTALNGQTLVWHYINPIDYGIFVDASSLAFFFGTATYGPTPDTGLMAINSVATTQWIEAGTVDVALFYAFVAGLVAGQIYNFRIRSIRVPGVWSPWVEVDGAVISITLSNTTGIGYSVAPAGTLTAQALSDGSAQITVLAFTAVWGSLSVSCSPSPYILGSLNQAQLYYVYYIDPEFAGGLITPIATENSADFTNKVGYFLIGSIVTPSYTPRYSPGSFSDIGANTTQNPTAAYDSDITTSAMVQATLWSVYQPAVPIWARYTAGGDCVWAGFPNISKAGTLTLHVLCAANVLAGTSCSGQIIAHVGNSQTVLHTFTGTETEADYTLSLNPSTVLSTVSVEAAISISAPSPGSSDLTQWAHLLGFEIYIQ